MKPVIFVTKNENDKIEMSRKEFSSLIEETYEQGYSDGARASRFVLSNEVPYKTQSSNIVG